VEARVVAKLGPWKPLDPLARAVTDEAARVHGYHLVHGLRLAVGLQEERRRKVELDCRQREGLGPELAHEDEDPVTHNRAGNPMQPNNAVEESS
jgi:hypothetical protein